MAMVIETCMNTQFEIDMDNDAIIKVGNSNINSFKLIKKDKNEAFSEDGI